jgi:hypothetical protein
MFIKRNKIDKLASDMLNWRDLAHDSYVRAKEVQAAHTEDGARRGLSKVEAELRAAEDHRFKAAVSNNQMYDRFATRDAAVLSALASMHFAGLLEVRDELDPFGRPRPNNSL